MKHENGSRTRSLHSALSASVLVAAVLTATTPVPAPAAAAAVATETSCDRACLSGLADRLLDSMVAHDASLVPLARTYVATENSVPSALGMTSAWRTVTAATHRYYVIDPQSAQLFWISTLQEGSFESLSYGRIKVKERRISEVESYVSRSRGQGGFMFSSGGAANLPENWTRHVPAERRPGRAELLTAGRSIFDTQVESPPTSADCLLVEDGRIVGENPEVLKLLMPPGQPIPSARNADGSVPIPCGIQPGRPTDALARTDIADVEQGIVISIATVNGAAEPYIAGVPTESAFVPDSLQEPYLGMLDKLQQTAPASAPRVQPMAASQVTVELHRVYDGKVQGLMMLHSTQAPGARSPWVGLATAVTSRVIEHTTVLDSLTIADGEVLSARAPALLTMTVDGVGTTIQPGTYSGKVVLTVSDDIPVTFDKLPPYHYRTAIYVNDGKLVPQRSVVAAVTGGAITDTTASHVTIRSNEERFNGILVTGNSHYRIDHAKLDFNGNGGNDFAGYGAGIMSSGNADVTIDHSTVVTHGAIRTALFIGGNSTMHVNDSTIDVSNGTLPAGYKFNIDAGRMMEVPWMLGLEGNVRATNMVDNGTVYYNRSHIRAQGWGALSTDGPQRHRMYAKDTTIETIDSGYGAYALGDSIDSFSHCRFDVADVALIIGANGSGIFTDGTIVNSRRFGVMLHSGVGGGTLTIDKGSVFNTRSTAIQVKGRGTTIVIDNARINAGNGILLQAMINDDPMAPKHLPPPEATPGGGPVVAEAPVSSAVDATLRNVRLRGDIVNARTTEGDMTISLVNSALEGAVTTATAASSTGVIPTQQTLKLIGDVKNTFVQTSDEHGLTLSLDAHSHWTVPATSFLTRLVIAKGASVGATAGKRVALFVNGVQVATAAGDYNGRVELRVTAT